MRALKSHAVAGSRGVAFGSPLQLHQCPVCGETHEVTAVRAQLAYGRQLCCSPDCEVERRFRMRATPVTRRLPVVNDSEAAVAKRMPLARGAVVAAADSAAVTAIGRGATVMLPVTLETVDVPRVRRAIFLASHASVDQLEVVPVPRSTKVRLNLRIRAAALDAITGVIMHAVPAGEFGRLGRIA